MKQPVHSIGAAARRTGLSTYVLRIWQKRYGVVEPTRSGSNRRLYSEDQIQRLILLRQATEAGHTIGNVAKLTSAELEELAGNRKLGSQATAKQPHSRPVDTISLEGCLAAVEALDPVAFQSALNRAETALGAQGLLQRVIAPLAQRIGDLWRDGSISAAHEHFASAVLRIFLGHTMKAFAGTTASPMLLVSTPSGQLHEIGALLASATAAQLGWRITYLGANLPAAEIAGAARRCRARAVALSIVYPEDDPGLEAELARLRELLPDEVALVVGGRACSAYATALEGIGAVQVADLDALGDVLDELRGQQPKGQR